MFTYEEFLEAVKDELGDAESLVRDEQLMRWVNRGRQRLGITLPKYVRVSWFAGDNGFGLPDDYAGLSRLVAEPGSTVPPYEVVGNWSEGGPSPGTDDASFILRFVDPTCVSAGSAVLYYGANYQNVTGQLRSGMPAVADEAAVSFALSRFFKRIASTRADFRRYVTVTGQSGVEVADLLELAVDHQRDYESSRDSLFVSAPATFYGD